jgi:hypothetical protein
MAANGAGLDVYEEVSNPPREWNDAYFELLAYCLPGLALPEIEQLVLAPIKSLPERSFFDILTPFLRSVDTVYFNDGGLQEPMAVHVRSALANRMMASSGWRRLAGSRSASIERHIGPAIAVFFFNDYNLFQPAKCYSLPKGIDRLDPFLPSLAKLVESGPSLFVAVVTLNLLEVSPRPTHLRFLVAAVKTWLESYRDDKGFWVDHGIGHRVCEWIEQVHHQESALFERDDAVRFDVDRLLAELISLGVSHARRLEEALAKGPGSRE